MDIHFVKATAADTPLISSLAHKIWWQHYPDIISGEQITYMLDMMYSAAALTIQMDTGQNYTLIYDGADPVGYYALTGTAPHHFFLNKFYIDATHHRKGIGSAAFNNILGECSGFEEIALQVNRRNIKAVNFYFKQGFTIAYAKDFDCGGGYTMDDFWMVLLPR